MHQDTCLLLEDLTPSRSTKASLEGFEETGNWNLEPICDHPPPSQSL